MAIGILALLAIANQLRALIQPNPYLGWLKQFTEQMENTTQAFRENAEASNRLAESNERLVTAMEIDNLRDQAAEYRRLIAENPGSEPVYRDNLTRIEEEIAKLENGDERD